MSIPSHVQGQGPPIQPLPDGLQLIDAGIRKVAGFPVTKEAPKATGRKSALGSALIGLSVLIGNAPQASVKTLLNVSNNPTREIYREFNEAFAAWSVAQGNESPR